MHLLGALAAVLVYIALCQKTSDGGFEKPSEGSKNKAAEKSMVTLKNEAHVAVFFEIDRKIKEQRICFKIEKLMPISF